MINRSELRHACFRAKKGAATEQNLRVLALVEPLLQPGQRWDNFSQEWDIFVARGEIKIVKPETDLDFIRNTCLEKHFQVKHNAPSIEWDDRKANVITIVEMLMLDGLMTWENYNIKWGVDIDYVLKQVHTRLFRPASQLDVTDQMIQASAKHEDPNPQAQITAHPMTDEQRLAFEKFLARRSNA